MGGMTRAQPRLLSLALGVVAASGCSLIDAATGDPDDFGGNGPIPFCEAPSTNATVPTLISEDGCRDTISAEGLPVCAGNDGPEARIVEFVPPEAGQYELCTDGQGPPLAITDGCGSNMVKACLSSAATCQVLFLESRPHFLVYRSEPQNCGNFSVDVRLVSSSGPENECLDSEDDDLDELIDCEDLDCRNQFSGMCRTFLESSEMCDGIDQLSTPDEIPLGPPGAIDEGACACIGDNGCDDLFTGSAPGPYLCHTFDQDGEAGICNADCNNLNWCGALGATCKPSGLCGPKQLPEPNCLDGIDDDGGGSGDGLHDCADPGCMAEPLCQTGNPRFNGEHCNGFDDNGNGNEGNSLFSGLADEFACNCSADVSCADLETGAPIDYVCQPSLPGGPTTSVCAPRCDQIDWCNLLGGTETCDQVSGRCIP